MVKITRMDSVWFSSASANCNPGYLLIIEDMVGVQEVLFLGREVQFQGREQQAGLLHLSTRCWVV
jgi:hypothetical protein